MKRNYLKLFVTLLLAVALLAINVQAQEKIKFPQPEYTYFKLDNGLEIYVFEDHQVPQVEVKIWYRVGSLDEKPDQTGLAHLLEHTMFLGTEGLGKNRIHQLVKQVGGYCNASTSYSWTRYYEQQLPAANLELALAIESDRMSNLIIDPAEFEREREVVIQERRWLIDNQPLKLAYEEIMALAFSGSALEHQVIGWKNDLQKLTVQQAIEFYYNYYMPNNAVLSVAGAVDPQEVKRLVQHYFGSIKARPVIRGRKKFEPQVEERRLTVATGTHIPQIIMLYQLPQGDHPDLLAIDCLLEILVNKQSSRMVKEVKEKEQFMLDGWAYAYGLPGSSFLRVNLQGVATEQLPALEAGFDREVAKIIVQGVSEEELAAVKDDVLKGLVFMSRNINDLADMVVSSVVDYNDPALYQKQLEILQNLTPADIQRIAETYLVKSRRTVGYIVPEEITEDKEDVQ